LLKKYLGWTESSATSDNEDTTASLCHSEVLSVKNPVRPPIPEFGQAPDDGNEVSPSVTVENSGDVFEENPTGSDRSNDTMEFEPQSAPASSQAATLSSHGHVLTRDAAANKPNCPGSSDIGHVSI
jgi:hypothetical protein